MLKFYVTHGEGKKTTKSDLHFPSKLYYFFVRAFVSVLQTSTKNVQIRQKDPGSATSLDRSAL